MWRKTGNDIWKKEKAKKWVYVTWYGSQGNVKYDVRLTKERDRGGISLKKGFRSKTDAKKYAMNFMAKNR